MPEWQIDTRLSAIFSVSDNVLLSYEAPITDTVISFSPGLNIRRRSPRLNVSADYKMDYLKFRKSGKEDLRHSLFATATAELYEKHLYFSGRAGIKQTFIDSEGSFSNSIANQTSNRRTVQSYMGGLNWRGKIANFAEVRVGYEMGTIISPADDLTDETLTVNFSDNVTHDLNASMTSGKRFNHFEWTLNYAKSRVTRSLDIADYVDEKYGGMALFKPNRYFTIFAGIGKHSNNAQSDKLLQDGGYKELGVRLTPGPKLSINVSRIFEGVDDKWNAKLRYLVTKRIEIIGSFSDTVSSNALVLLEQLKSLRFNEKNGIEDSSGLPIDQSEFRFSLSDTDFRRKSTSLTLKWRDKRNTSYINWNREHRIFDNDGGDARSAGYTIGWDRAIDRSTNLKTSATLRKNLFAGVDRSDKYITGDITWENTHSRYFTSGVTFAHSKRTSNELSGNLKESSLTVNIRGTF